MVVEFKEEDDEACCTHPGIARIRYGLPNERKLHKVMTALNGALTLQDLRATYPRSHWLEGDRHWQIAVPLAGGTRLILEPTTYVTRAWHEIESVRFVEITDYHK